MTEPTPTNELSSFDYLKTWIAFQLDHNDKKDLMSTIRKLIDDWGLQVGDWTALLASPSRINLVKLQSVAFEVVGRAALAFAIKGLSIYTKSLYTKRISAHGHDKKLQYFLGCLLMQHENSPWETRGRRRPGRNYTLLMCQIVVGSTLFPWVHLGNLTMLCQLMHQSRVNTELECGNGMCPSHYSFFPFFPILFTCIKVIH